MLQVSYSYLSTFYIALVQLLFIFVFYKRDICKKQAIMFPIIASFIMGTILCFFGSQMNYILIFILISLSFLILKLKLYPSFLAVSINTIIASLAELLFFQYLVNIKKYSVIYIQENLLLCSLITFIDYFVIALVSFGVYILQKKKINFHRGNKVLLLTYVMSLIGFLLFNFYYLAIDNLTENILKVNVISVCFFLLVSIIYIVTQHFLINKQKENEELKMNLETIEELSNELRRFKHNYLNLLHGFAGYLENEEWETLKEYYSELVKETKTVNNDNFLTIQKIKMYALFGLISAKIKTAKENDVNFRLEINEEINKLGMKSSQLCEVLGIYLDNAIESAILSDSKEVILKIIRDEKYLTFILDNSYHEIPNMAFISKGVSTKGEGRGIGLKIAKKILSKQSNTIFNTYLLEDNFRQEIILKLESS